MTYLKQEYERMSLELQHAIEDLNMYKLKYHDSSKLYFVIQEHLLLFVLLFAELDSLRGRIVEKVRVMLGPRNAGHQEVQLRCSHGLHRHEDCQS